MLELCGACGGRIISGGDKFIGLTFCGEGCSSQFKAAIVDQILPAEDVSAQVAEIFHAPCPLCGRLAGNDLYSATRITGLLLAYHVDSETVLCCAACGRKNRLVAAAHCLFLGWWSIRSAFFNIFVLPTNLIASIFISEPDEPSAKLASFVKVQIANRMQDEIATRLATRSAQENV